jgi:hypothetical protein
MHVALSTLGAAKEAEFKDFFERALLSTDHHKNNGRNLAGILRHKQLWMVA